MKNFLAKLKKHWVIVLLVVVVIAGFAFMHMSKKKQLVDKHEEYHQNMGAAFGQRHPIDSRMPHEPGGERFGKRMTVSPPVAAQAN